VALLPLKLPPGVFRSGTEYSSAGRWYDANLVRFYQTAIRPMGGWRALLTATVSGAPRALYTWRANNATRWVAVGTHTGLYAIEGGITLTLPSGKVHSMG
jgi:hypothetical protein